MAEKKFILGYSNEKQGIDTENPDDLTLFPDEKTADFESEEWVAVFAETEVEARFKYHETFAQWQQNTSTRQPAQVDPEPGAAQICVTLEDSTIIVRHTSEGGATLLERKAVKGDWDNIWMALRHPTVYTIMLEALQAIAARVNGEYTDPALLKQGLLGDMESDVVRYAEAAIQSVTTK